MARRHAAATGAVAGAQRHHPHADAGRAVHPGPPVPPGLGAGLRRGRASVRPGRSGHAVAARLSMRTRWWWWPPSRAFGWKTPSSAMCTRSRKPSSGTSAVFPRRPWLCCTACRRAGDGCGRGCGQDRSRDAGALCRPAALQPGQLVGPAPAVCDRRRGAQHQDRAQLRGPEAAESGADPGADGHTHPQAQQCAVPCVGPAAAGRAHDQDADCPGGTYPRMAGRRV